MNPTSKILSLSSFIVISVTFFVCGCSPGTDVHALAEAETRQTGTSITLKEDSENKGKRCEAKRYDHGSLPEENTPEYKHCLNLQKQLSQAVRSGDNPELVRLLEAGANVNGAYYNEDVPLGMAIMAGQTETVKFLLENGAEVNVKHKWDETPLHRAAYYNFVEIAKILLENGAEICSASIDDRELTFVTALDIAQREGHREMIRLLEDGGAEKCPSPPEL